MGVVEVLTVDQTLIFYPFLNSLSRSDFVCSFFTQNEKQEMQAPCKAVQTQLPAVAFVWWWSIVLVKSAWGVFLVCAGDCRSVFCRGWVCVIHTSELFGFCLFLFAFFGDYIMCRFSRGTKDAAFLALTIGE